MPKLNMSKEEVVEENVEQGAEKKERAQTNIYIFENQNQKGPKARVNFRNPLFSYSQATLWSREDGSYQVSSPLARGRDGQYIKKKDGNYIEIYRMPSDLKDMVVDKYLEAEKAEQPSLKDVVPGKDDIRVYAFLRLTDGAPTNGVLANIEIDYNGIRHSQISVMQSKDDPEEFNVKYPIVRDTKGDFIIGKDGYPIYYFSPASKVARDVLDEVIMDVVQEEINKTLTD